MAAPDPVEKLRYVHDDKPGFTRKKRGKRFAYYHVNGARITDETEIKRIQSIGIPPAYKNVWICPWPNGHIQATGFDQRGRKQYRYHPQWRQERDAHKFHHVLKFVEFLPVIRKHVQKDIKLKGLPKNKVLAAVVHLLEVTLIRVGNSEYARDNHSYGLTTLRDKHILVEGADIRFAFTGKSGKEWSLAIHDARIAKIVKKCADIPGHELFKYVDDHGNKKDVTSADVNAYLQEITGEDFTAKDFRTWAGTMLAALALKEFERYDSAAQARKNIVRVIEKVAKKLGNTPAICRKCYVHPMVLDAYVDNALADMIEEEIKEEITQDFSILSTEEIMVMAFLKKRLEQPSS